jgi:malonate transporter and related proteins
VAAQAGTAGGAGGWQQTWAAIIGAAKIRLVLTIFQVTFPFFALVLCGYLATRRGLLPLQAIPGLNAFVLFFALPCMLFKFCAGLPVGQLLNPSVLGVYSLCALLMVALTVAVTLGPRIGWNDAAMGALVAAFPNTGFMGVPLLVALLGAAAAGPAIVTIVVDMLLTTSLCIALSRLDPVALSDASIAPSQRMWLAAKRAFQGVAANPMPWAIALGTASSALSVALPRPLMQTVTLLADAASPVALFTIGAVMARSQLVVPDVQARPGAVEGLGGVPQRDYLLVAAIKLLLHPALVGLVGSAAISLGVPLQHDTLGVLILVAALPSASNVSLLAERFGANNGRIARIILVSTAAAFVTFSVAVSWVRKDLP